MSPRPRCGDSKHHPDNNNTAKLSLYVSTTPHVPDARELQTILVTSLRALYGQLEPYSATVQVVAATTTTRPPRNDTTSSIIHHVVTCPAAHAARVQAALTVVTPPPYLQDVVYRFDVVRVQQEKPHDND